MAEVALDQNEALLYARNFHDKDYDSGEGFRLRAHRLVYDVGLNPKPYFKGAGAERFSVKLRVEGPLEKSVHPQS